MRVLLSFNPQDVALVEAFRASLFVANPDFEVFFSPALFEEHLGLEIEKADAWLLFVGKYGLSDHQLQQWRMALQRRERDPKFILLPVLAAGAQPPETLPHDVIWIEVPIVTDRSLILRVIGALKCGDGSSRPAVREGRSFRSVASTGSSRGQACDF